MSEPSVTKLRFGVMCSGTTLQTWMALCIRQLVDSGVAEPALLIRDVTPPTRKPISPSTALYDLYDLHYVRKRCRAMKPMDASTMLAGVPQIDGSVTTRGKWSQYFSDTDVEAIRGHDLDFILRFGFNIIRGEILNVARYGVWSYHHDNERLYRGGPPCFWEIANQDDANGAILQRITDRLDGGVILHRGFFPTCKGSWVENFDRALFASTDWCARAAKEIALGQLERVQAEPTSSSAPILRAPNHRQFFRFAGRAGGHLLSKAWQLLFHVEVWNVGIAEQTLTQIIQRGVIDAPVTWLRPHLKDRFIADPFPCEIDGQLELLVEDFDQSSKGNLRRLSPPYDAQHLNLSTEIERAEHLSYPCVFTEDGRTYCVPECYQSNRVLLYELLSPQSPASSVEAPAPTGSPASTQSPASSVEAPAPTGSPASAVGSPTPPANPGSCADLGIPVDSQRWQCVHTLLEGLPVVDPTLFKHEGRYWLFFTLQDDGCFGNLKLYAYYADELRGEYKPHSLNPLKCDARCSRPAGSPVVVDGRLYRPAQDCTSTYGAAISIEQITELSPTRFEEHSVARLAPAPGGPYPDGLHTINALGQRTVVDGKRFEFDPLAWRNNLKRWREIFL